MELGHFLSRSGLTYPEVSSKFCHDSFCHLGNSVSLPWVVYWVLVHITFALGSVRLADINDRVESVHDQLMMYKTPVPDMQWFWRKWRIIWCDFDRASSLICGNKMPTRCNRGFYCRSYCLLNMFRASLCPSSGAQEYYTVVAACGISCCGFSDA